MYHTHTYTSTDLYLIYLLLFIYLFKLITIIILNVIYIQLIHLYRYNVILLMGGLQKFRIRYLLGSITIKIQRGTFYKNLHLHQTSYVIFNSYITFSFYSYYNNNIVLIVFQRFIRKQDKSFSTFSYKNDKLCKG